MRAEMNKPDRAELRPLRQSDVAAVHRLINQTIDSCYPGVYPPRAVAFFRKFHTEDRISQRLCDGVVVVIVRDREFLATGALVDGDIFGVFVHPGFQRRGYGRTIMHALEGQALQIGHDEVVLSVSLPSRAFYEGLGYEVIEDCFMDVGEGQRLDFWKARKRLKAQ